MHPLVKKTRDICQVKKTRLCLAADLIGAADILRLAREIGDQIAILKTHVDIIRDFTPEFSRELSQIATEKNFLIFEDRKFADIGNTVAYQFAEGIYEIANWADFINAHTLVGPGIIEGLAKRNKKSALLLLAQMTPKGSFFDEEYALKTVDMALKYPDFVCGFIGSPDKPEVLKKIRKLAGNDLLILTPGIQFDSRGDTLGQTYHSPTEAIENGSDILIVGRGIYRAPNPQEAAIKYQEASWV